MAVKSVNLSFHQRDVRAIVECTNGGGRIYSMGYKQLAEFLVDYPTVTITYPFGDLEKRQRMMKELGYRPMFDIFFNMDSSSSPIKQVWTRENEFIPSSLSKEELLKERAVLLKHMEYVVNMWEMSNRPENCTTAYHFKMLAHELRSGEIAKTSRVSYF